MLVAAPVVCGLVVAGLLASAWLALGRPTPAAGAVWLQVAKLAGAEYTDAPDQPFFVLVVGTGARSDDPNEQHDDPGLADAIHVIGINPALRSATILDIPRDTEGPTGAKLNSYIVNSNDNFGLRAQADAVSSVTGLPITYVVRANFPNFVQMIDEIGGIDVDDPLRHGRRELRRVLHRRARAPHRRPGARALPRTATRSRAATSTAR